MSSMTMHVPNHHRSIDQRWPTLMCHPFRYELTVCQLGSNASTGIDFIQPLTTLFRILPDNNNHSRHLSSVQCVYTGLIGTMINLMWMMDFTTNEKQILRYVPYLGPIGKRVIRNVSILVWKRNSEKDLVHPIMCY